MIARHSSSDGLERNVDGTSTETMLAARELLHHLFGGSAEAVARRIGGDDDRLDHGQMHLSPTAGIVQRILSGRPELIRVIGRAARSPLPGSFGENLPAHNLRGKRKRRW